MEEPYLYITTLPDKELDRMFNSVKSKLQELGIPDLPRDVFDWRIALLINNRKKRAYASKRESNCILLIVHSQGSRQGQRAGASHILASQTGTVLAGRDKGVR